MEKIKNKNLIKSILITLSLVITLSVGLVIFKDNVNVVKADSVEVELESQVNKVSSSATAPTIDNSYFDVTSPNWSSKFDFLTTQAHTDFTSTDVLYPNSLYFDFVSSDTSTPFDAFFVNPGKAYFYNYDSSGSKTLTSLDTIGMSSWGIVVNNNTKYLQFTYNSTVSTTVPFFVNVSDYVLVTSYNNNYYITCSPSLYSQYNVYLKAFAGSSLTENEVYQNGYNVGYNKGFNDGNKNVIDNPNNYNLYNKTQYDNNYNKGKNDGISTGEYNVKNNPNNYDLYTQTQYDSNFTNGKNIGYSTGYNKGVAESSEYTFIGLIGSVIDAPIKAFTGLFNFELLGFNLLNFIKALFTLMVIIVVARFIVAKM